MRSVLKIQFLLGALMLCYLSNGQNPAGLTKPSTLWYSGGTGITGSTNVSLWADQSSNNYDVNQSTSANQPTITKINFTNVLSFDGGSDYMPISGLSYTGTGSIDSMVAIVVFRSSASGATYNSNWAFLDFDRSEYFDFYLEGDGQLGFSYRGGGIRDNSGLTSGFNDDAVHIGVAMFSVDSVNDTKIRVDGSVDFEANNETTSSIGTATTRFGFIGDGSESSIYEDDNRNGIYYDGEIAEVIYFENRNLTESELLQIETYLALKYGASLSSNYVISGGVTIWNQAVMSGYADHIAGIGRDDGTSLDQRKSMSENGEGVVIMEKPSFFGATGDFILWGNDDIAVDRIETGTPSGYQYKSGRTWRVDMSGVPGNVSVSYLLSGLNEVSSGDPSDYALAIKSDPNFDSGALLHTGGATLSGDTITFTNVPFSDGDFFTLAFNDYQPGGIGGYEFWITAGAGVYEDASATDEAEDGDEIFFVVDQSGNGHNGDDDASGMLYNTSNLQLNFHPVFEGTTSSRGFDIPNANEINLVAEDEKSYVVVFKTSSDISTTQFIFEEGGSTNGLGLYITGGKIYASGWTEGSAPTWETYLNTAVEPNTGYVLTFVLDGDGAGTGTVNAFLNGGLIGTYNSAGTLAAHSGDVHLGTNASSQMHTGNYSTVSSFIGEIAEMLYYNQTALSSTEVTDLESSLAMKYGLHLSGDYINSSGSTIWNSTTNNTYHNDVTVIGRDDNFLVDQMSSITEDGESLVAMTSNSSLSDLEFMFFGNDGSGVGLIDNQPVTYESRLERIWYVQKDAGIGTVDVKFLPLEAGLSSQNASDYALLVDGDVDLSDADEYVGFFDGDTLVFSAVNFSTGDLFSFAATSVAPGGVGSGLVLWYNAEIGLDDASDISEWRDLSGNGYDALQSSSGSRPRVLDSINFHPVVNYDGDDYLALEGLSFATANSLDNLSVFVVYKSDYATGSSQSENWSFLDFDRSDYFNFYMHGNSTFGFSYEAGGTVYDNYTTSSGYNDDIPRLTSALYDNSLANDTRIMVDGVAEYESDVLTGSTALGSGTTRFGFMGDGSEATGFDGSRNGGYFEGEIAELIYYQNNLLSESKIESIQSYLGLKYGLTLGHDYRTSTESVIWNSTTLAAYQHQVTGIIRDDGSSIDQLKSRSTTDSSLILVERNSSWSSDLSYMIWGNDYQSISWVDGEVPDDLYLKLEREWRVESSGVITDVTIKLDTVDVAQAEGVYGWFLLTDADGDFSDGASIVSMTLGANGLYEASGLTIADNSYFTFAKIANITAQTGDFNVGSTWVSGQVPKSGDRIVVDDNHVLDLVGDVNLYSIKINTDATLEANTHQLVLTEGSIVLETDGEFSAGTSEVVYGFNGDQDIAGLVYYDLSIDSSGTKTVIDKTRVCNELKVLSASSTLDASGNLTMCSDASGTARLLAVPTGAVIVGDATVERYVGATARKWWHLSSPVTGATVQDWRDDFPITGDFVDSSDLGGSNNASMYWYDETQIDANSGVGWEAFPSMSLSESIVVGRGYRAFLREDGSNPLNDTVIDLTGVMNYGAVALEVAYSTSSSADTAAAGWSFVGNPYASEVDWNNTSGWSTTNMSDGVYVWNAINGLYQSYVNDVGVNGGTGRIASGQGFWVRAIGSSPDLTINEAAKTTTATDLYKGNSLVTNLAYVTLSSSSHSAEMALRFEDDATRDFDPQYDGYYFGGDHPVNICSYDPEYNYYAIEALPLSESVEIPLYLLHPSVNGTYSLKFTNLESFELDHGLVLVDLFEGVTSPISNDFTYTFEFDGSPSSNGASRFVIQRSAPTVTNVEVGVQEGLHVYPTKLKEHERITINSDYSIIDELQVRDVEGRVVYSASPDDFMTSFSADFGHGLYLISIQRGKIVTHRKLIID